MEELYEAKKAEVVSGQVTEGMDLFGALLKGSGVLEEDPGSSGKEAGFQRTDILGNAFVIMLAGHETTANAIHFSLILLAMHWESQHHLQKDLDKAFQNKPIEEWTYEGDFPQLFNGMAAAVMNETLRLLQPIVNIPKSTAPGRPQQFKMGDQQYLFPGDTKIWLSCAIHRHPKYWPSTPSAEDDEGTDGLADADRFRPERWLSDTQDAGENAQESTKFDDDDLQGPSGAVTSAQLFKPIRGSYVPFSDGYRSCIGRRFAQVEILTVLAVIFSQYSVELAVDAYASDAEIETMPKGGKERKGVWQKAADRADHLLRKEMGSIITLQLRGGTVPLRLVPRGKERFVFE